MTENELLKTVEKMLKLGIGDLERLVYIKEQLQKDGSVHPSDKKYLDELIENHLKPREKYHLDEINEYLEQTEKSPYEIERDENTKSKRKNMTIYVILVLVTFPLWLVWDYTQSFNGVWFGALSVVLGTVYLILRFGWKKDLAHKLSRF